MLLAAPSAQDQAITVTLVADTAQLIPVPTNSPAKFVKFTNPANTAFFVEGSNLASVVASTTASVTTGGIGTINKTASGTLYVDGTYTGVPLTGGSGSGAKATITVLSGSVTTIVITTVGSGYKTTDTGLSASNTDLGGAGSGLTFDVTGLDPDSTVVTSTSIYTPDQLSLSGVKYLSLISAGTPTLGLIFGSDY